jgi:hypothetical protein
MSLHIPAAARSVHFACGLNATELLHVLLSDSELGNTGQVSALTGMFMSVTVLIRCFTGLCNYQTCNRNLIPNAVFI